MKKILLSVVTLLLASSALASTNSEVSGYLNGRFRKEFNNTSWITRAGDWLSYGDWTTYTITLYAGTRYWFYGACDSDCGNLDLYLYNRWGDYLAGDNDGADEPYFSFRPSYTDTYTIKAYMADCDTRDCNFGFDVVEQ